MSIKKIKDAPIPCSNPEHEPPHHMVYEPGTYEHVCPGCGKKTVFEVPGISCRTWIGKEKLKVTWADVSDQIYG